MAKKSVDIKSDYRILSVVRKNGYSEIAIVEDEEVRQSDEVVGYALYLYGVILTIHVLRSALEGNTLEQKIFAQAKRLNGGRAEVITVDQLDKKSLRDSI